MPGKFGRIPPYNANHDLYNLLSVQQTCVCFAAGDQKFMRIDI
jgi:hypothetical protein